ncbi:hypothetical protein PIB30_042779 [Stylosanthes scabra]|uniref:Uncharacterized protein n=1 Tax=Stylosanthes scabra TaxID=79078 RepID=A0ABU6YE60_9FABA|nr:hypothetical protein [Stylosanthes scabra]
MFNSSSLPFPTQFSASRPDSAGVGGSSNPSPQTPIHSSSNFKFVNTRGLEAINLNNDEIEDTPQESVHYLKWEDDEILIGNFALGHAYDDVENGLSQPQLGDETFAPYHKFLERNAQLRNRQKHQQLKEDLI